jgi:hypothetical protein
MTPDLEKKLFVKFPNLYRNVYMIETCDGWFDIIWKMSKKFSSISGVQLSQIKEKYGTLRIYIYYPWEIYEKFPKKKKIPRDLNSKEKRRWIRRWKTEKWKIDQIVDEAENASFEICENCGVKKFDIRYCQNCNARMTNWGLVLETK